MSPGAVSAVGAKRKRAAARMAIALTSAAASGRRDLEIVSMIGLATRVDRRPKRRGRTIVRVPPGRASLEKRPGPAVPLVLERPARAHGPGLNAVGDRDGPRAVGADCVELRRFADRLDRVEDAPAKLLGLARACPPLAGRPIRATSRTARSRRGGRRRVRRCGWSEESVRRPHGVSTSGSAEALGRRTRAAAGQRVRPQQPAEVRAGAGHPLVVAGEGERLRVERLARSRCRASAASSLQRSSPESSGQGAQRDHGRALACRHRRAAAAGASPRAVRMPAPWWAGSVGSSASRQPCCARPPDARRGPWRTRPAAFVERPLQPAARRPPGGLQLAMRASGRRARRAGPGTRRSSRRTRNSEARRRAPASRRGAGASAPAATTRGRSCPAPRRSRGSSRPPCSEASTRRVARAMSGRAGRTCSETIAASRPNRA